MLIAEMPPAVLVTSPERYQTMISHLRQQESIAIDTESNSLFAYQERVCLIQLSSREKDFLLDPFAFSQLPELGELMADSGVEKVLHAGDYDIATLKRDYGFEFRNVFDTMLAATAIGEANLGLGTLLEKFFDIHLVKKYQRANWGERPLKEEMLAYAQADSHFLIDLRDLLILKLRQKGWLELVREDSNAMAKNLPAMKAHVEDVWRVKGVFDLNPTEIGLLDALNHYRELQAEKRNRPPFKVFGDAALIAIAKAQPCSQQDLERLNCLSPQQLQRYGNGILATTKQWQENPVKLHRLSNHRFSDEVFERHEILKDWRKRVANREGVASNLILPRDLLDNIARQEITSLGHLERLMEDYPIRFNRFGEQIFNDLKRRNE